MTDALNISPSYSNVAVPPCRSAVSLTVMVPRPLPPCLLEAKSPSTCVTEESYELSTTMNSEAGGPSL